MRILVAEDEEAIRRNICEELIELGHEVDSAQDGEDAYRKLDDGHFDLLITDNYMPYRTGLELLKILREDERFAELPVIVHSSASNIEEEANKYGARYCSKYDSTGRLYKLVSYFKK